MVLPEKLIDTFPIYPEFPPLVWPMNIPRIFPISDPRIFLEYSSSGRIFQEYSRGIFQEYSLGIFLNCSTRIFLNCSTRIFLSSSIILEEIFLNSDNLFHHFLEFRFSQNLLAFIGLKKRTFHHKTNPDVREKRIFKNKSVLDCSFFPV